MSKALMRCGSCSPAVIVAATVFIWMLGAATVPAHAQSEPAEPAEPPQASDPARDAQMPLVPRDVPLNPAVRRTLDAEWLSDDERRDLRVTHGIWSPDDLDTVERRAIVALNAWRFDDPVWDEPGVPADLHAELLIRQGEAERALELLDDRATIRAARLRAEAYEMLGRFEDAQDAAQMPAERLQQRRADNAEDLTEAVRALFLRSRLRGQPTRDFQTMLNLLAQAHQTHDRLYWPSRLAEAELLLEKDRPGEAVPALHEVLRLNPRCAEAWYHLGRVAVEQFDFGSAQRAVEQLRRIDDRHPLADLLHVESRLTQNDPDTALEVIEALVDRAPKLREAHALLAATHGRRYDDDAMRAALERHDELSPGRARAHYVAGRQLAYDRQYGVAAEMLRDAIDRQPYWPAPQIELGLLQLQSGHDEEALAVLRRVSEFDRFNRRAANSLHLLEQLVEYETIETDNFIIRHKPGIDAIIAEMMPQRLEQIHEVVVDRFQHAPDRRTIIELMPDHQQFAVRVAGMPFIHTVAACTGPVIAMEVPREGPRRRHLGTYDWPRVVQHEYAHTVTLSQTRNRIPHWLTEAAAVDAEQKPRDYDTQQLLARAYHTGTLFDLDAINWAFIRPERPTDRAQAYAQGHWMVEFMDKRFGERALLDLMDQYFDGRPEREAMQSVFGMSRDDFFEAFQQWAAEQVEAWGLDARPRISELVEQLREDDEALAELSKRSREMRLDVVAEELIDRVGKPAEDDDRELTADDWPPVAEPEVEITDEIVDRWLDAYPDHPDIVELALRRRINRGDEPDDAMIELLEHYATLRPGDMFPHRRLANIYLGSDAPERAIVHLEALDAREERSPVFAVELARLYRAQGEIDRAFEKATRALHINPYHAANRELAAALAIESGRLSEAHMHLRALTLIEPDREQHERRLEAIERMMGG